MANRLIIGVDTGNRCMKTKNFNFTSGFQKGAFKPVLDCEYIKFNGSYYSLTDSRLPYMEDKTETEDYFVLTLFAIAKELEYRKINVGTAVTLDLAVGLPPAHIGRLKDRFIKYFKRDFIQFEYKGTLILLKIENVYLYPQGYAAILTHLQEVTKTPKAYIVDIGGYTTDVILLRNGTIDMSFCESFDMGVIEFFNDLKIKLKKEFGRQPDEQQIEQAITKKLRLSKKENITERINDEARVYSEKMLRNLNEMGVDLVMSKAFFIGGGSLLFKEFIEQSDYVDDEHFVSNVSANAAGYEILAKSLSKKQES